MARRARAPWNAARLPHRPANPRPLLARQDFLRSIPLKLLSCDLFEEWMGALDRQNEEDRIEALKQ